MNGNTDDDANLGQLIRVHKTSAWNYWWLILLSCLMLTLLLLMYGITDVQHRSHVDALPIYEVLGVLTALPLLALYLQLKNQARFYEMGIVYENRRWVKTAQWAEICDVWEWCARVDYNGLPLPNQLFYAVRTVDGMRIRFSPRLNDIADLGSFLKSEAVKWGVPVRPGVPPIKNNLLSLLGRPN